MATVSDFLDSIITKYPQLDSIYHTYQFCSRYNHNKSYLVNSQDRCINFDKLTEWECSKGQLRQSADSLSFNASGAFLIEFKSGNPLTHDNKYKKLISSVSGKVFDSDITMSSIYQELLDGEYLPQRFCLVVDASSMGIDPLGVTLAQLSIKDNDSPNVTINKMLHDIKNAINLIPMHYSSVEIWYSQIFDTYLSLYKIINL